MKKTKHGDYARMIKFPIWSSYKVEIIFTNNLIGSHMSRFGPVDTPDEGTDALHTIVTGISQIFYAPTAAARVISHEAWHAIYAMFKWAGVERYDDETVAYHLGWLIGEITEFQNQVFKQLKSRTKEEAPHERKTTSRPMVGLQGMSAYPRGVAGKTRKERETGPPSAQADGCGDN